MAAYLIQTSDTKEGVLYPTVIGPFATEEQAVAFQDWVTEALPYLTGGTVDGSYIALHLVCRETCDQSPEEFLDNHDLEWPATLELP